jgi:antitoxin component YwqK of YwqJK toxin-antitoxin module
MKSRITPILFLFCCFGKLLSAQPLGIKMDAAPFKLFIRFSEATSRLMKAGAISIFFGSEDSNHVFHPTSLPSIQYDIPNRVYFGTFESSVGNDRPDIYLVRHDVENDTMLLKLRFYLPPGITDSTQHSYYVPTLTFFAGTYEVNELSVNFFEYLSRDDDRSTKYWHLGDSIQSRDSAGYRIATQSTKPYSYSDSTSCNVGWTATWSSDGKLKTLAQYDDNGRRNGYAIEYYPSGRMRQRGQYKTEHHEEESVKLTLFGPEKKIHHYFTTDPVGTWVCYHADGTEYYRGPYDVKVLKKFKRVKK